MKMETGVTHLKRQVDTTASNTITKVADQGLPNQSTNSQEKTNKPGQGT